MIEDNRKELLPLFRIKIGWRIERRKWITGATGEEKSERRSCVRVAPLRWNATRIRSTSTHDREVT